MKMNDNPLVGVRPAVPERSNTAQPTRRSLRLRGYDYSQAGAYFVTVCVENRTCLFGGIVDGEMRLNDAGRIVADEWMKSGAIRNEIELDEWVVMPNHFHGKRPLHNPGIFSEHLPMVLVGLLPASRFRRLSSDHRINCVVNVPISHNNYRILLDMFAILCHVSAINFWGGSHGIQTSRSEHDLR
jgi:hypothetical protein